MIGYAFPSDETKIFLYNNLEIIFIDEEGFWIFCKETSKRILLPKCDKKETLKLFNSINARKYLEWYMPIWTRWVPSSNQVENNKDQAIYKIFNIFSLIHNYKVDGVIFNTSVAHHLDSVFISIACRLNNINQIYLYCNVINLRLLPIFQSSDIESRKVLNIPVNDYSSKKDIETFIEKSKNNLIKLERKGNFIFSKIFKNYQKIFLFGCMYLLAREIYNLIKKIKYFDRSQKNNNLFLNIEKYSVFEDLKQMYHQKIFLKKFSDEIILTDEINNLKSQKKTFLLIAAHLQPEATSFPEGDKYYNHIDIAMTLRRKNYDSQILYKEHPAIYKYLDTYVGLSKIGISRSVNYVKLLKKLGCIFLPTSLNLSVIDDNDWYVPITITGTIAIERSLAGLHTIYTGNPWYKGLPGTIHIDEIKCLKEIPKQWSKVDESIKKEAKIFMNQILNYNTLPNITGISTGRPDTSDLSIKEFKNSVLKIIEWYKYK
jgi:hypothetical protein